MMRPIYYDTETTGLKAEKDRIIELALYDPTEKKTFSYLIHPEMPIPEESKKITGITDEMVKDAPKFKEIIPDLLKFLDGSFILIAHNNDAFDVHFLKEEFKRAQQPFPDFKFLDTLKWAKKYRPDLTKHSLQYLREIYKIAENNAHRALDDVIVLEQVFSQMLDDLPIEKAHELIYQKPQGGNGIQTMPFGKHKGIPLGKLPKNYLEWLKGSGALEKPENDELKKAIEKVLVEAN
jgi:DNA polymerase-3 subunit epsilon